ncbi:MAG: Sec-independent protein translocase subunit TatA/TatB [Candidatus Zipacnadales bacterium]
MFGSFGTQEIILILILVLVLFGAKRIPEIMRGFGEGIREFKAASQKALNEIDEATRLEPSRTPPKATTPTTTSEPKVNEDAEE